VNTSGFSLVAYFGAWVTVTAGIWFMFDKTEQAVTPEVREAARAWVKRLSPTAGVRGWPEQIRAAFDAVFGTRPLSLSFIARSCATSLGGVGVGLLIWMTVTGLTPRIEGFESDVTAFLVMLVFLVSVTAVLNFLPDYLSVVQTRFVVSRMTRGGSPAVWLLADLLATTVLAFSMFGIMHVTGSLGWTGRMAESFGGVVTLAVTLGQFPNMDPDVLPPPGLWFYSTFVTSVWVWLYALGGLLLRGARRLDGVMGVFRRVIDVEAKPIRSIGYAAVLITTLLFLLMLPLVVR
jgi:hypothetical protein